MMNFLLLLLTSAGVCLTAVSGEVERRLNVSEAAPPGTIVGHIDARGPVPGGQPNFYIVYPNPNGRAENDLNVNEVSGEITVKRILDFETTREYVLLAVPTDGSPGIRVTVEVLDENDNAPVFPVDQIQLEISEYARMQAEMPLPSATDADSGAYGVQKYRISGGNVNNVFRLATKKLNEVLYVDLVVNGELDREYRDHYDLEIEALDAGEPPKRGTLRVHVQTLDANDNAPEFLKPRYMATVPATATVDDEVLQVQARDADIGENARISYRFSQSRSNVAPKFRIEEPTGIIRVFDAHLVHGSIHELLVVASDHGLPQPLESTAFVTITVASGKDSGSLASLDIVWLTDDGQPQLFENVTIGAVLARISVVSAQKSELSMTGSTVICMRQSESSNIYLLIVCGPLNRESDASYRLAFVLKSVPEGNVLLEQPVVVEVNDVNDNAPEWSQDTYRIAVNRSSLHDAVVYQFIARDADEGENGRLRYQLSGTDVFKIDERTGILTMTREMDCAMGAEVKFTIAASDHGKPPLTSSCTVIVDITDLNAKPPVFEKTLYEVTVKEDADVGTCLLKVVANDSNCGSGSASRVRYALQQTSKGAKTFRVDEKLGTICLTSKLDYEMTTRYQLTVEAHDPMGRTATSLVNVFIEDVNDNAPVFHPTSYNISVREDTPSGAPLLLVSATDGDYGTFGQLGYYLESGDVSFFQVDNDTGQLFLKEPLNRSSKSQMFVQVQVKDGGGLVSDQPAQVTVAKVPMYSAVPQFTKLKYSFEVAEDILPGIAIGRVEATGSGTITYSISSGDPDQMFSVDKYSGRLTVSRYLDADHSDSVLLNVKATLESGGANYTQVVIHISDTNDNDPVFEMDTVEVNVPEDQPLHEPFFAVQATDKDKHKNGELTYELIRSDPPCPAIVKPLTGQVLLAASLDYESVKSYKLRIKAQDQGMPPRSSAITVILNVIDVNDNAPLFEKHLYTSEVPEDAKPMTELITLKAHDPDTGFNGKVSYRIDYGVGQEKVFGINPTTGTVYVKEALDREEKSEYFLTIIASDQGAPGQTSNATLQIRILDINDNAPNCGTVKPLTVSDNTSPNEAIGTVEARDPDQGENGTVRYRMQQANEWFDIRPNGDVFLKKKLPFDVAQKVYHITVIAQDQSVESKSSTCPVVARFDQVLSTVTIIEPVDRILRVNSQCPPGCLLTKINATNAGRWSLEANAISHFFDINEGVLSTKTTLTPEVLQSSNHLVVNVFDKDNRRKQLSFLVRPKYTNVGNTNSTRLLRIPENLSIGSLLGSLGSEGQGWFYTVDKNNFFDIDEATGNLYLTDRLDYSTCPVHSFTLKRTSLPGYEVNQTQIVVEISDENQYAPTFQRDVFYWSVKESTSSGAQVGQVVAGDVDGDDVVYRIIRASKDGLFSVDSSSGEVFLQGELDYYTAKEHYIVIEADDTKHKVSATVVIDVEDANDNAPVFISPDTISIQADSKEKIHRFVAIDFDSGDNARLVYSLVDSSPRDAFKLDSDTGDLTLTKRINASAKVKVRVSDSGNPPKSTEQIALIRLAKESSKWMFFDRPSYDFTVHTDTVPDTLIHKFGKEDTFGVDFQLFPKAQKLFRVDKSSGEFATNERLDIQEYKLILLATSFSGNETDWSTITVRSLGSQNLYTPQINPASCGNVSILENVAVEGLRTIFATDQDQGENGRLSFKIESGNQEGLFKIDESSGVVSCAALDRELKPEYFLVISVQDNGSPVKADTCTLRVKVLDENDNVPVFDASFPEVITLTDSTSVGDVLFHLNASDPDLDANGAVEFVLHADRSGLFDVNPRSGALSFARDLPSLDKEWEITVRAQDRGLTVVRNSTKTMKVVNRRSKTEWSTGEPEFLRASYVATIPEGLPRGQFVAQIDTSNSITHDAPITYSIVGGNKDAAFEIAEDGAVFTKQELDAEIQADYVLSIIGSGKFSKSPETTFVVRVLNVNDNSPSFPPVRRRSLSENVPVGTQIGVVSANDVDKDSVLEYSLETGTDLFHIDRSSGALFLKKRLDYETASHHEIGITVSDGVHSASTVLSLQVTDENDNAPKFPADLVEISVPEGGLFPIDVGVVSASDPDQGENGEVRYELLAKSELFAVNKENGTLTVMEQIEPGMSYFVTVKAADQGSPPLFSFCTLKINLVSQTAQAKVQFDAPFYTFVIAEDQPLFKPFGKLNLVGSNVSTFSSSDPTFQISHKGEISLVDFVDREKIDQYRFRVDASTRGQTASATVIVQISDINDNAPVFVKNASLERLVVSESLRLDETLTRLSATDADVGDNAKVKYSLLSGSEMLAIDEDSGALRFGGWNKTTVMAMGRTVTTVIVKAEDQGDPSLWSIMTLDVVYDVDTSSLTTPFFPLPTVTRHVPESLEDGSVIFEGRARNLLGVKERHLQYSLKDNDEVFIVNETSGEVHLRGGLDFEKRTTYEFTLAVTDSKGRSATVPVHIRVLGVDEYAPVFTRSSYTFQIPLSAEVGQRIGTVFASDSDVGIDGRVKYSMRPKPGVDYISIDTNTGILILKKSLDVSKNFTLDQVEIVASSGPVQHSRTTVYLEIGDFPSSSTASSTDFTIINIVTIVAILLFLLLSALIIFLIARVHRRNRSAKKPQKQIYSVSRGNIAVMADLNRVSPKFQRVPMPLSETMATSTYSDDSSVILRPPRTGLRSQPQSQPDSGIDPDAISMNSSVTDYLMQIGVTPSKLDVPKPLTRHFHGHHDGDLSELIYANVDDIIGPGTVNHYVPYNADPMHSSFLLTPMKEPEGPKFQPLSDVFSEIAKLKDEQRKKKTVKVDI